MANTESRVKLVFEGSERGVVAAAAKSAAAIRGLSNQNTTVGKSFAAADQQATKFIGTVTKAAKATSLVASAGGLIGQAFSGGLPALVAMGAAAGTVAIGIDAIKAETGQLLAPFGLLKKAVEDTFTKGFRPAMAEVAGIIPKLTAGFVDIATSINDTVQQLTGFASSVRGVSILKDVLGGTADFISGINDGLVDFIEGILDFTARARSSMQGLGEAFGSIFGQIGGALKNLPFDTVNGAVQGFSATLTGLGKVIGSVTGLFVRLAAAFGDSFGVLLTGLADGIDKASPGLVDLGLALGDLLRAIAPLLPTIGELAGSFAHSLADGIRAVIPYVQQFADWAKNNVGTIKAIAEGVVALALAVKALNIFTSVAGWVSAAQGALKLFTVETAAAGTAAEVAGAKTAGFGTKLGGLKGIAAGVALGAVAVAMDKINTSAAGGSQNLQGFEENLNDISRILSGDWGNPFEDINRQLDETKRNIQSGQSLFGAFLGSIKRGLAEKLPDLNFNVNTGPAAAQIDGFIAGVNKNSPTVNINGNTNGAAFALREILAEIAAGKSEVIIDGQPMPAQEALKFVEGLVNNSNPMVNINGNPTPAGDALAGFLKTAQGSTATATLNANPVPANETVGGWTRRTEGTTGMAQMNANPVPANGVVNTWVGGVSRTRGTATLDANPAPGNSQVAGWKGRADGTTGTAHLSANPAVANSTTTGWKGAADRTTATAHLNAEGGAANSVLQSIYNSWYGRVIRWTVSVLGGAAAGGPIFSGAVHGPGTGTSDTAGLFRLSNGEHVLTARDVQAMGGQAGVLAFRRSLNSGRIPRMTATGGRAASGGAATAAGALSIPAPQVNVAVHIDGNEVRSIVRTEIASAGRATRRTVTAGVGTTF